MPKTLTSMAGIDHAHRHPQPSAARLLVASVASIVGSLIADALIVAIGEALMPDTKGYEHFRFSEYGPPTVVGVVGACIAWQIVTRDCAKPRPLFFRLAILVSLVLFFPDVYILLKGEPGDAVGVLVLMHLAIALVTYNLLVRVAPPQERPGTAPR